MRTFFDFKNLNGPQTPLVLEDNGKSPSLDSSQSNDSHANTKCRIRHQLGRFCPFVKAWKMYTFG